MKYLVQVFKPSTAEWLGCFNTLNEASDAAQEYAANEFVDGDSFAIIPVADFYMAKEGDDRNAVNPADLQVTIDAPRTPFNISAAISSLARELNDLAGREEVEQAFKMAFEDADLTDEPVAA